MIFRPKNNVEKILYKLHDKLYGSDAENLTAFLVDFRVWVVNCCKMRSILTSAKN